MNDLGRRYFLFSGTARGKQTIAGALIAVAAALDLAASLLAGRGYRGPAIASLFAVALGIMLVALYFMFTNRRRT